jgi:hypothetical protein
MKKSIITTACLIAFTVLTIFSCKKEETTPTNNGNNGNPTGAVGSFTWTENGGPVITADSAFWTTYGGGIGIRASKGGFTNYFEINWAVENDVTIGSKVLAAGDISFTKDTTNYANRTTQNLTITKFANNQLSGNFTISVTGGPITPLAASFNAIPKK